LQSRRDQDIKAWEEIFSGDLNLKHKNNIRKKKINFLKKNKILKKKLHYFIFFPSLAQTFRKLDKVSSKVSLCMSESFIIPPHTPSSKSRGIAEKLKT
jgi:hypothetical protein